jgi:hypothetical protein
VSGKQIQNYSSKTLCHYEGLARHKGWSGGSCSSNLLGGNPAAPRCDMQVQPCIMCTHQDVMR